MDFTPDEDHAAIADAVTAACADFGDEYWTQCDTGHRFPTEFYDRMAAGGWVGIAIPERFGGGGRPARGLRGDRARRRYRHESYLDACAR